MYEKMLYDQYKKYTNKELKEITVPNGYTEEEVQANCDHEYTSTHISATYFLKGYNSYKCTICGYSYKGDYSAKKVLDRGYLTTYCRTGKRKLILFWNTVADASGYQIRYCKKKDMKNGVVNQTVKGQSKYKKTISKLARKKKYYVQVRAYKKSGSKTVYGKWSAKKSLRTK